MSARELKHVFIGIVTVRIYPKHSNKFSRGNCLEIFVSSITARTLTVNFFSNIKLYPRLDNLTDDETDTCKPVVLRNINMRNSWLVMSSCNISYYIIPFVSVFVIYNLRVDRFHPNQTLIYY